MGRTKRKCTAAVDLNPETQVDPDGRKLPKGWVLLWSKTRQRHYYGNPEKNISQWEFPPDDQV